MVIHPFPQTGIQLGKVFVLYRMIVTDLDNIILNLYFKGDL